MHPALPCHQLVEQVLNRAVRSLQIVAGIAGSHAPSELVGRQVAVLANMKPAKLFGVESRGMIFAADAEGAVLLMPEKEVKEGTRVR